MQYNYFNYPNQKLPNYGSVQYFAYRKLSDEKKEILYLLDQIKSQIISCTELYNNIEVANEKMNWWLKELNNLKVEKMVSSPHLKKLSTVFDKDTLYSYLVEDISHTIENSSVTERAFIDHIYKNFIGIESLKALYLNDFNEPDLATIEQLNANNEIARNLFCIPKHFYNQIVFDTKITPSMTKANFDEIAKKWVNNYKKIKVNKNLKPLIVANAIHYKMARKFIKRVDNPFKETIHFSPLTLLFYSVQKW